MTLAQAKPGLFDAVSVGARQTFDPTPISREMDAPQNIFNSIVQHHSTQELSYMKLLPFGLRK